MVAPSPHGEVARSVSLRRSGGLTLIRHLITVQVKSHLGSGRGPMTAAANLATARLTSLIAPQQVSNICAGGAGNVAVGPKELLYGFCWGLSWAGLGSRDFFGAIYAQITAGSESSEAPPNAPRQLYV